jgi:hypothetical protein
VPIIDKSVKSEESNVKVPNDREIPMKEELEEPGHIHTIAKPSIVLAHRVVPGTRPEGFVLPIHTYSIRDANQEDFETMGGKRRGSFKENIDPIKRMKL